MCCRDTEPNFSSVPQNEWPVLCQDSDAYKISEQILAEIHEEICPRKLAENLCEAASIAHETLARSQAVAFYDEKCSDKKYKDYIRKCILIIIDNQTTFNQFFNGRCGYRAMYWQSAELGKQYNDYVIDSLLKKLNLDSIDQLALFKKRAKIWPFFETRFLNNFRFDIARWRDHANNKLGCRISNPEYPAFIIKGPFINSDGLVYNVKSSRHTDLYDSGWT